MKTKQETFDTVAKFLLNQGGPSIDKELRCVYRGQNGKKCAIGCLIPDDKYNPEMDNNFDYGACIYDALIANVLIEEGYQDLEFLKCLQSIHDDCSEIWDSWMPAMIDFALENNLSTKVFNE